MSDTSENINYVYALLDNGGIPFYIGCGRDDRSNWWRRKGIRKILRSKIEVIISVLGEVPIIKIFEDLPVAEATNIEKILIKTIGIHPDGPLLNSKYGGPGGNRPVSLEAREAISNKIKRLWLDSDYRQNYSEKRRANTILPLAAKNIADANRRRTGRKVSSETKLKMSIARKNYWERKKEARR